MRKPFANRVYFDRYELILAHDLAFEDDPIELLLDRKSLPDDGETFDIVGWSGNAISREKVGAYESGMPVVARHNGPHFYSFAVMWQENKERWVLLGSSIAFPSDANRQWGVQLRNVWEMVDKEREANPAP